LQDLFQPFHRATTKSKPVPYLMSNRIQSPVDHEETTAASKTTTIRLALRVTLAPDGSSVNWVLQVLGYVFPVYLWLGNLELTADVVSENHGLEAD
ncbi:hypothetical protein NPIL_424661, partial [Nephila pilipes]